VAAGGPLGVKPDVLQVAGAMGELVVLGVAAPDPDFPPVLDEIAAEGTGRFAGRAAAAGAPLRSGGREVGVGVQPCLQA